MKCVKVEVLVGAYVSELDPRSDEDKVTLALEDGRRVIFTLDGDCCSSSHFTDSRQFLELVGSRIISVEEREDGEPRNPEVAYGDESTSWHFLVFTTDKGHVTIDWRNASNGYYDGWLVCAVEGGVEK